MIQNWRGHFLPPHCHGPSQTVYLLQYSTWGHHSLGFYAGGQFIEFTYGDWALFALNKRDMFTAISHMLWPTQGTLGRKAVNWQPDQPLRHHFTNCIDIAPFQADSALVAQLYTQLDSAFRLTAHTQIYHPADDIYFVHYPTAYALWHNCNHELVYWLKSLGGQVRGIVCYRPNFTRALIPCT